MVRDLRPKAKPERMHVLGARRAFDVCLYPNLIPDLGAPASVPGMEAKLLADDVPYLRLFVS